MWLVFDIGNSAIKGGLIDGGRIGRTFTVTHDAAALASVLDAQLGAALVSGPSTRAGRAGLASVVPTVEGRLTRLLQERGLRVTRVHPSMQLPFKIAYRTPETLGTDRLAAAAAAWQAYGVEARRAVVAIDAGTALTFEVVDRHGVYLGGPIAPGPALMQRALHRETAQLPEVPLERPEDAIGRSTVEAIQSGIMNGFVESVRGLLRRIDEALEEDAFVVATGGWSELLCREIDQVRTTDPHLVLQGVRILMEMNP